jgi:tetratricopeptide (TPR) repeat protein
MVLDFPLKSFHFFSVVLGFTYGPKIAVDGLNEKGGLVVTYVFVFIVILLIPSIGNTSPCHEFPWNSEWGGQGSDEFSVGRQALEEGLEKEALVSFRNFIQSNPKDERVEAVLFVMATLIHTEKDPSKEFLETIELLRAGRQRFPDSPYAPWALCRIGSLYQEAEWFDEARGSLEQFLIAYPDHPLTPGVLISAGLNFLRNDQNLEGALVFRRILDEPKWAAFHLEAGLGLADGAAASQAWDQASYWYQTIELEKPELIRASPYSLYLRGTTELGLGNEEKGMNQFLQAINLHPYHKETGRCLTTLADMLLGRDQVVPGLWFAKQASTRFPNDEADWRGRATVLRWVVKDFSQEQAMIYESGVRQQLAELGIAVPSSWSQLREEAGGLVLAGPKDISFEAKLWIAQSYQAEGQVQEAIDAYVEVLTSQDVKWSKQAAAGLKPMLVEWYQEKQWTKLSMFLDGYANLIPLFGKDPHIRFVIAETYRAMALPAQALDWYQKALAQHPSPPIHEATLAGIVFMAAEVGQRAVMKEYGNVYEETYPDGPSISRIAFRLGEEALANVEFQESIQQFLIAEVHAQTESERIKAKRLIIWAKRQGGDRRGAIQDIQQLIKEKLADTGDRLALADLLFDDKQFQKAATEYEGLTSAKMESDLLLWAEYRLALSYRNIGKLKESDQILATLKSKTSQKDGLGSAIMAVASAVARENSSTKENEGSGRAGRK